MKKLVSVMLGAALFGAAVVGMSACGATEDPNDLKVYAPDGAPALALVNAIAQEEAKEEDAFDFEIVDANTIATYVTGNAPKADICVLPANAAAKMLGTGTVYQMLGTVTNGNLYFLTTGDNQALTAENLKTALVGKKVGVVQLTNVPGLTLQAVLKDYGVDYTIVQSTEAEVEEGKTNLIAFTPDNVTPAGKCDYYLCPEPAVSAKIKGTASSGNPFKMAGDLQALYGDEDGYPQAVVVAKKSVIESRQKDVETFMGYLKDSKTYLENTEIATILELLDDEREDGLAPSFNAKNLTKEVVARCSVRFTASKDCMDKVKTFLEKLIAVNAESTKIPDDGFFYRG